MSEEQVTIDEVVTDETLETEVGSDAESDVPEVVTETEETKDEITEEATSDLVAEALKEKERLQAELDALKTDDSNVFEDNAKLKAQVEEAKKLQEVASENARLKAQLEDAKRQTIIDSMIKRGQISNDLKGWADSLTFEQLQQFSASAPRRKSILEETNNGTTTADQTMLEFHKQQSKSRIIS